jgi:hypothetical protein
VEIKYTIKKIQIPDKKLKKIIEITRFACQNIKQKLPYQIFQALKAINWL